MRGHPADARREGDAHEQDTLADALGGGPFVGIGLRWPILRDESRPVTSLLRHESRRGEAQIETDAAGNSVVLAPDGTTEYAFPRSTTTVNTANYLNVLPTLTNAPVSNPMTYGNPQFAYSTYSSQALLNQNGTLVTTDLVGVESHSAAAATIVLAAQQQADGTFGPNLTLWSSPNNDYTGGQIAQAIDMNRQNLILGATASPGDPSGSLFLLYNLNTQTQTDLSQILPNWHIDRAVGIDDEGRILVDAVPLNGSGPEQSLLLTPAGVTAQTVATPEPSACAVLGVGLAALAWARRRRQIGGDTRGDFC